MTLDMRRVPFRSLWIPRPPGLIGIALDLLDPNARRRIFERIARALKPDRAPSPAVDPVLLAFASSLVLLASLRSRRHAAR